MKPLRFILWEEWTNQSDTICITSLYYDPYYDVIDQVYPNSNPNMHQSSRRSSTTVDV